MLSLCCLANCIPHPLPVDLDAHLLAVLTGKMLLQELTGAFVQLVRSAGHARFGDRQQVFSPSSVAFKMSFSMQYP